MKTIIIDAGHGGTDAGAVAFGVKEKDWNLKMSMYQYERLKQLGAKVALARTSDVTLDPNPRASKIKDKYHYCISNHFNAFNGQARGIEAIHSIFSDGRFAKHLAEELRVTTGLPLRRVFTKKNNVGTDWYFIHRLTGYTETVIIEYGFLDNQSDYNYYKQEVNFYKAAEAVVKVICQEVGVKYLPNVKGDAPKKVSQKLYRVQTGAFANKANAEKHLAKLKKAGFDAFITE